MSSFLRRQNDGELLSLSYEKGCSHTTRTPATRWLAPTLLCVCFSRYLSCRGDDRIFFGALRCHLWWRLSRSVDAPNPTYESIFWRQEHCGQIQKIGWDSRSNMGNLYILPKLKNTSTQHFVNFRSPAKCIIVFYLHKCKNNNTNFTSLLQNIRQICQSVVNHLSIRKMIHCHTHHFYSSMKFFFSSSTHKSWRFFHILPLTKNEFGQQWRVLFIPSAITDPLMLRKG